RDPIERGDLGVRGRPPRRDRERGLAGGVAPGRPAIDLTAKHRELAAILGGRAGVEGQPLVPAAAIEPALPGIAAAQRLVDDRRAGGILDLDRAELAGQRDQLALLALRRDDVMRAPRIARDLADPAARRATGDVVELDHDDVADAAAAELPRRGEPGDARADD